MGRPVQMASTLNGLYGLSAGTTGLPWVIGKVAMNSVQELRRWPLYSRVRSAVSESVISHSEYISAVFSCGAIELLGW